MTKRKSRPDFSQTHGCWLSDEFLSPKVIAELRAAIPRRVMTEAQVDRFLKACSEWAHSCSQEGLPHPASFQRNEMRKVSTDARRLLNALTAMNADTISSFNAHFDYLALGSSPPVALHHASKALARGPRDERFLSTVWDLVEDLLLSAEYSASKIKPDRSVKPGQQAARRLVFFVASAFVSHTGKRPPVSKETWFPEFMEILGQHLGLSCGRALVDSVVNAHFPAPANPK